VEKFTWPRVQSGLDDELEAITRGAETDGHGGGPDAPEAQ